MRHRFTTRALTDEERQELRRAVRSGCSAWLDHFLPLTLGFAMGYFPALLMIAVIGKLVEVFEFSVLDSPSFHWGLQGASAAAGVLVASREVGKLEGPHRRERQDLKEERVEVLRVDDARVVEHQAHNDEGPIYYFGIGGRRVLCLRGQWMFDLNYGLPVDDPRLDPERDRSFTFPASSFTVHRLSHGGRVLAIDELGDRLEPDVVLPFRTRLPPWMNGVRRDPFSQSLVLEGSLDELIELKLDPDRKREK